MTKLQGCLQAWRGNQARIDTDTRESTADIGVMQLPWELNKKR